MRNTLAVLMFAAGAMGAATFAQADPHIRAIAATCMSCHGTMGKSPSDMPRLDGMEKGYFVQQMKDFTAGTRPATLMQKHSSGYTDDEIEKLGAYFAAIK